MKDKYFSSICYLDTNIFVYMHDSSNKNKQKLSNGLYKHFLSTGRGRISVQIISEWRNVMMKRYFEIVTKEERRTFIKLCEVWNPLIITPRIVFKADELCDKYNLSAYDSIHVQCALEQNCEYFLSEDMQNGLIINGVLTISNPYL